MEELRAELSSAFIYNPRSSFGILQRFVNTPYQRFHLNSFWLQNANLPRTNLLRVSARCNAPACRESDSLLAYASALEKPETQQFALILDGAD
jgi:hypothetical protein